MDGKQTRLFVKNREREIDGESAEKVHIITMECDLASMSETHAHI